MYSIRLTEILEKLHIKNSHHVAQQIIEGYSNKYGKMPHVDKQIGGVKIAKEPYTYKGVNFLFYVYDTKDIIKYAIHPESDNDYDCLSIIIDKQYNYVSIGGISYNPICFNQAQYGAFTSQATGSLLFNIGLKFIDQLKKNIN